MDDATGILTCILKTHDWDDDGTSLPRNLEIPQELYSKSTFKNNLEAEHQMGTIF